MAMFNSYVKLPKGILNHLWHYTWTNQGQRFTAILWDLEMPCHVLTWSEAEQWHIIYYICILYLYIYIYYIYILCISYTYVHIETIEYSCLLPTQWSIPGTNNFRRICVTFQKSGYLKKTSGSMLSIPTVIRIWQQQPILECLACLRVDDTIFVGCWFKPYF